MICQVVVPGEPVPKGRPRKGQGRWYTPTQTSDAEDELRWGLRAAGVLGAPDADWTMAVSVRFYMGSGQRKDIDNLVKLVLDACNGFVWHDDVQVVALNATIERGAPEPRTWLQIARVDRYTADCGNCGTAVKANRRFCSRGCYDEHQRKGSMRECSNNCGTKVYRQRSDKTQDVFCSIGCRAEFLRGRPRAPGNWQRPSVQPT